MAKQRKKPKINLSELLRKHKAGKSIGSTNRARLVARGLVARKSGSYKGKKKDLGNRGKV
jgi:antitoxin (DNA-binding transcriptional repressor) of toxin-antitoxin stability system